MDLLGEEVVRRHQGGSILAEVLQPRREAGLSEIRFCLWGRGRGSQRGVQCLLQEESHGAC